MIATTDRKKTKPVSNSDATGNIGRLKRRNP